MAAITDPNDPRLNDPAYANDPDVLAYLNQIYGAGGTVYNPPTPTSTWNAGTQAYNPTGPVTDPNDPRLSDPAHATDPDVLSYLNGIYGPQGTVYSPPAGNTGWNPQTQAWNTPPAATQAPPTDPGTVGGGGGGGTAPPAPAAPPASGSPYFGTNIGDFTQPFTEQFNAPTPQSIPDAPVFKAPDFKTPDPFTSPVAAPGPFTAPSPEEAMKDPGYQFTLGQGLQSLLNSRAAGGKLNSGETGKALIDYGQAAGATQYGNVYNRDLNNYNTNYQTQYVQPYQNALNSYLTNYKTQYQDPYQNAFQGAQAEFAPKLTEWQTQAPMIQSQNNTNYLNAYNKWLSDYNMFANQQDRAFNKFSTVLGG